MSRQGCHLCFLKCWNPRLFRKSYISFRKKYKINEVFDYQPVWSLDIAKTSPTLNLREKIHFQTLPWERLIFSKKNAGVRFSLRVIGLKCLNCLISLNCLRSSKRTIECNFAIISVNTNISFIFSKNDKFINEIKFFLIMCQTARFNSSIFLTHIISRCLFFT